MITIKVFNEGGICPYQLEGETFNHKEVYARYRYGKLTVEIDNEIVYDKVLGDNLDGYLTFEQLQKETEKQFRWIKGE
jgi:hypothetical protein